MTRLIDPASGTVVHCEGDLAEHYLTHGWADANATVDLVEATPEKPKATVRRKRS